MEDLKHTSRRLTKKPPLSHAQNLIFDSRIDNSSLSLRSQRSSGSLQRAPSAPYPRSNNLSSGHVRTATSPNAAAYASSNSSLDRQVAGGPSPTLAGSEFGGPPGQGGVKRFSNPTLTRSLSEQTSEEFVGLPFDGTGILNHIDSTKASGYQNLQRRPPPPPLSHTSPHPRMMSPPLRQSQSFSTGDSRSNEKTPPRVGETQLISSKRYSDETKDTKNAALKKKSGFAGFMNSLVGSPRRVNISAPENPVHVTHVGYDNETGQFTVSISFHSKRSSWQLTRTGSTEGMAAYD